jgi:hypothetical protein
MPTQPWPGTLAHPRPRAPAQGPSRPTPCPADLLNAILSDLVQGVQRAIQRRRLRAAQAMAQRHYELRPCREPTSGCDRGDKAARGVADRAVWVREHVQQVALRRNWRRGAGRGPQKGTGSWGRRSPGQAQISSRGAAAAASGRGGAGPALAAAPLSTWTTRGPPPMQLLGALDTGPILPGGPCPGPRRRRRPARRTRGRRSPPRPAARAAAAAAAAAAHLDVAAEVLRRRVVLLPQVVLQQQASRVAHLRPTGRRAGAGSRRVRQALVFRPGRPEGMYSNLTRP